MSRATPTPASGYGHYWEQRLGSAEFRRTLTDLIAAELRSLSRQTFGDVIDLDLTRAFIERGDEAMHPAIVADLAIETQRLVGERLRAKRQSLHGLLDGTLVADIEALLDDELVLSEHAEDFIARLMRREFMQNLFTDIIHTALVSFYSKVNPLFGAFTMRAMEDQIRGFIRLFIPRVQQQATEFIMDRSNQAIFADFSRAIVRELLHEPLPQLFAFATSTGDKERGARFVTHAATNPRLRALSREMSLAVWEGIHARLRDKRIGDVVRLTRHAEWFAARGVETIVPILERPQVRRFVAGELARAAAAVDAAAAPAAPRPARRARPARP